MDDFENFNFDDSIGNINDENSFDDIDSFNLNDEISNSDNEFNLNNEQDNSIDNQSNIIQNQTEDENFIKKHSLKLIAAGVIIIILVIIIGTALSKSKNRNKESVQFEDKNVNSLMQTNQNNEVPNVIVNNIKSDDYTWTEIKPDENVEFTQEANLVFTVTTIKHLARPIDANNNLSVITKLRGSLSGLSGTYDLYIPYDKGNKLNIGNSFNVKVQLGNFNDKTVVGNIVY